MNHQKLTKAQNNAQARLQRKSNDVFKVGDEDACQELTKKRWTIRGAFTEKE